MNDFGLLGLMLGYTAANFLWALLHSHDYRTAAERSWFQLWALLGAALLVHS